MATDLDFVRFVCDQIHGAGAITHRKMFGEYALYSDGKVVALLCDNQFFLKPTDAGRALLARPKDGFPYPGAKPHLLIDEALEDGELLSRLVAITAREMAPPGAKAVASAKNASSRSAGKATISRKTPGKSGPQRG